MRPLNVSFFPPRVHLVSSSPSSLALAFISRLAVTSASASLHSTRRLRPILSPTMPCRFRSGQRGWANGATSVHFQAANRERQISRKRDRGARWYTVMSETGAATLQGKRGRLLRFKLILILLRHISPRCTTPQLTEGYRPLASSYCHCRIIPPVSSFFLPVMPRFSLNEWLIATVTGPR